MASLTNGHDFEQAPGDGEEQGSLVYCIPWGCKESDMTEQLNNNNRNKYRDSLVDQLVKNLPANAGYPSLIPGSGRSSGEGIGYPLQYSQASLVAQKVKNLPAMWETWV